MMRQAAIHEQPYTYEQLDRMMLRFDDILNRLGAVLKIAFGNKDKLQELDISPAGFKASFWALPVTVVPLVLGWAMVVRAPDILAGISPGLMLLFFAFIQFSVWIVPLMLIIAAAGLLDIRDRIIPFVIVYNWGQAFLEWFKVPFVTLRLVFPAAYQFHMLFIPLLLIFPVFFLYRLFQVALNKPASYMIVFFILYIIACGIVGMIAAQIIGISLFVV